MIRSNLQGYCFIPSARLKEEIIFSIASHKIKWNYWRPGTGTHQNRAERPLEGSLLRCVGVWGDVGGTL